MTAPDAIGDFAIGIPTWVDITSAVVGAASGSLVAVEKRLDIAGVLALAIVTGLGGGMIRDTLLQKGTPVALTEPSLLPSAVITGMVIFLFAGIRNVMGGKLALVAVIFDAVNLGVFAAVGTAKALDAQLPGASCVLLGVLTGVGGGILRDLLLTERPAVLRPGTWYGLAAAVGATLQVVGRRDFHFAPGVASVDIVIIVGLRLLAVWRGWETPLATDVLATARAISSPLLRQRQLPRPKRRRRADDAGSSPRRTRGRGRGGEP